MNTIKFLKINFSKDVKIRLTESRFLEEKFDESVIGVTEDKRIVYDTVGLTIQLIEENYGDEDIETDEDEYQEIYHYYNDRIYSLATDNHNKYGEESPIFCFDDDYLFGVCHELEDNVWTEFNDEFYNDEEISEEEYTKIRKTNYY